MKLFLIPLAVCLAAAADPAQEVLDLFTNLAASLSAGNAEEFMGAFDKSMPGYSKLRDGVTGLTKVGGIESSVEVVRDEGDAQHRTVEVDWRMRIKSNVDATASVPRQQTIQCKLEKKGRKWKIVSLDPVGYFAP
jgi:hypothetical protein